MLVGFATILLPDTMYQLFLAFMFCLVHMLFTAICQPYRAIGNDYFALCCNFSLTVVFFFSIFLKVDTATLTLTPTLPLPLTRHAAFLTARGINHGINLRRTPSLQYLYYLAQVGLAP